MSDVRGLSELLVEIEAASEPNRELDIALLRALSCNPWRWHRRVEETITWEQYGTNALGNPICSLERFTESLDGAIGLCYGVLPGAEYEISTLYGIASVSLPLNSHDGPENARRDDGNVPLAFCAAILKAVIAERSKHPSESDNRTKVAG